MMEPEKMKERQLERKPEYDGSDSNSYQSDDSIKEAGLDVTSIANLRRRSLVGDEQERNVESIKQN